MFTLKSLSLSPSRPTLSIPISPSRSNPGSPSSAKSPSGESGNCFPNTPITPTQTSKLVKKISKEEALKNVKILEDVLGSLNDYRLAVSNLGKSGRKLANALKELSEVKGGGDKVDIASQTMRPTASMLDNLSDLTLKLARKIDKEYDEVNSDASKYFTLLAKESRTHDAYLGAISKKHDKAEKAYRKASKAVSDTSNAHAGLLILKDTLSEDVNRANEDHQSLIGTKQSLILLKIASTTGVLSENIFAYFSDGLRKSGQLYPDIEYFRALADIKWQSSLPPSLEHETNEGKQREEIRGLKAKVALGEMDMIGQKLWENINNSTLQTSDQSSAAQDTLKSPAIGASNNALSLNTKISDIKPNAEQVKFNASHEISNRAEKAEVSLKDEKKPIATTASSQSQQSPIPSKTYTNQEKMVSSDNKTKDVTRQTTSPPIPHHTRPSLSSVSSTQATHQSTPSNSTTSSTSTRPDIPAGRRPIPSGLLPLRNEGEPNTRGYETNIAKVVERPLSRYEENTYSHRNRGDVAVSRSSEIPTSPPATQVKSIRPGPIPIQTHGSRRSVSNIVNDLQSRQPNVRYGGDVQNDHRNIRNRDNLESRTSNALEMAFQEHQTHQSFIKGCELCEIDHERMIKNRQLSNNEYPTQPPKNTRRVTMPPIYTSFDNSLPSRSSTSQETQQQQQQQQRYNRTLRFQNDNYDNYDNEDYDTNQRFNANNSNNSDRRTSYEYDELFNSSNHQNPQFEANPNRREVIAPKPRRPINLSPELERYHN